MAERSFVRVAASAETDSADAAEEISRALGGSSPALVLFFASTRHDIPRLAAHLGERMPGALTAGCSTMGELGPAGATRGAASAIAFDAPLRAAGRMIEPLSAFRAEDGAPLLRALSADLGLAPEDLTPDRHCLVTLTDGLSGMEETLVSSLGVNAPRIPLVGGSAGDDFAFRQTWAALDGKARPGAAVVLLLQPGVSFLPFHVHHFHATEQRVVVTRATPERRLVHEIDGWPAVDGLARALGIGADELRQPPGKPYRPLSFGVRVGASWFMRAVMTVQGDDLLMGGAVPPGTVMRVMQEGDLVAETVTGIRQAQESLGQRPTGLLLFNCGGRMLEAEGLGAVDELSRAMSPCPSAGFTTYGEQYGPLQLNHTLTGLMFGAAGVRGRR